MNNNELICEHHGLRLKGLHEMSADSVKIPVDGTYYQNDHAICSVENNTINFWWDNFNVGLPILNDKWSDCNSDNICSTLEVCFSDEMASVVDRLSNIHLLKEGMVELL